MGNPEYTDKVKAAVPACIILLGLTPVLMVLIPWDFGNDVSFWRDYLRYNSLVIPIIEFAVVMLAMAQGFSPAASIENLSGLSKTALAILTACTLWTTIFVASVPANAMLGIGKYIAHFLFALAFLHKIGIWSAAQRDYIWPAIGLGVIGYCALLLVNIAFFHPVGNEWMSLVPALTNIRWIGFFALASFCAAIGTLRIRTDRSTMPWQMPAAMLFATVGLIIAFWSGTRAAVVAISAATILSVLLLPIRRQTLIVALVSTIFAILVTLLLPVPHPLYGIERIIGASNPALGMEAVSSNRFLTWAGIIDRILDRPLMGWGIDQMRYTYPKGGLIVRNTHQGLLQILVSTGLCGLVAYLCLAVRFAQSMSKTFSESYQFAAVAYLGGALIYGLYDGFYYFTYPVMILLVAAACLVTPPTPASGTSD